MELQSITLLDKSSRFEFKIKRYKNVKFKKTNLKCLLGGKRKTRACHVSTGERIHAYHQMEDTRQTLGGATRRMPRGAMQLRLFCDTRPVAALIRPATRQPTQSDLQLVEPADL